MCFLCERMTVGGGLCRKPPTTWPAHILTVPFFVSSSAKSRNLKKSFSIALHFLRSSQLLPRIMKYFPGSCAKRLRKCYLNACLNFYNGNYGAIQKFVFIYNSGISTKMTYERILPTQSHTHTHRKRWNSRQSFVGRRKPRKGCCSLFLDMLLNDERV